MRKEVIKWKTGKGEIILYSGKKKKKRNYVQRDKGQGRGYKQRIKDW